MKTKIKKVQDLLWFQCKRIVRAKYGNTCYTCGKPNLEGSSWQTGHIICKPKCKHMKYDLRILRPQCFQCNINLSGNGAIGLWLIIQEMGFEHVKQIFDDLHQNVKINVEYYEKILHEYEKFG